MISKLLSFYLIAFLFLMAIVTTTYSQDSTAIWYKKGIERFEKRDYSQAVIYLTKYLEKDKSNFEANYNQGIALYRLQRFREALRTFRYLSDSLCNRWVQLNTLRSKLSIQERERQRDTERKCDSLEIPVHMYVGNCEFRMGNYWLAQIDWVYIGLIAGKNPVYDPETGASLEVLQAATAKMINSKTK